MSTLFLGIALVICILYICKDLWKGLMVVFAIVLVAYLLAIAGLFTFPLFVLDHIARSLSGL